MAKTPKTEFGRAIVERLCSVEINQTQEWLVEQVHKDTGMFIDSSYLCKIMVGKKKPKRIIDSICRILDIEYSDEI